jgi:DNA-directed RNA polymerase subunit RPC12/RpoP
MEVGMLIVDYACIGSGGFMPRCPHCGYKIPIKYIEEYLEKHDYIRCPKCKSEYLDLEELDYD